MEELKPNQFRTYVPETTLRSIRDKPGTLNVAANTLAVHYDPFVARTSLRFKYGNKIEEGYNSFADMGDYEEDFSSQLYFAVNKEHMAELKFVIDKTAEMRRVSQSGSFGQQLVGDMLDPINLFSFRLGSGLRAGQAAFRGGVGLGAIEATREVATNWADPFKTAEESVLNVLGATILGGAFAGGATAFTRNRAARAVNAETAMIKAQYETLERVDRLQGLTPDDVAVPREDRELGNYADDELSNALEVFQTRAAELEAELEAAGSAPDNGTNPLHDNLNQQLTDLAATIKTHKNEIGIREMQAKVPDINALKDPYAILPSFFTNSVLYKAVSTPMKRALQGKYPTLVKENFVKAYSDSGVGLMLNSIGLPTPNSVAQKVAVANGRWVMSHDKLLPLWASETGASSATKLDINMTDQMRRASGSDTTYRKWLDGISQKRINKDKNLSENEIAAINVLDEYFADAKVRLEQNGLIGTKAGVKNRIAILSRRANDYRAMKKSGEYGEESLELIEQRLEKAKSQIRFLRENKIRDEESFSTNWFPRFYNQKAIMKNREGFAVKLRDWYSKNLTIERYNTDSHQMETIELIASPEAIEERVQQTISNIIGDGDSTSLESAISGSGGEMGRGRSKHFMSRNLEIPNELILDFIHTEPLAVMQSYAARIEPRVEFQQTFGKGVDSVILDMEVDMIEEGFSRREINKVLRDFNHMYDRVSGSTIRDGDAISRKIANVLREAASFSFMGSSGLSALPDFGRILLEYDLEVVAKSAELMMDSAKRNMSVDEIRMAGEAIDILKGTAHMRMVDGLANDIDASELLSSARNAFYILNGLAPLTTIAKQLAGIADGHTIIDYSKRYGSLTDMERTWLNRYGIGEDDAALIAKQPVQTTDGGLYMANTMAWKDKSLVSKFRVALNSGVLNTIMAGTPADKPIITDGVAYIPMNVARKFGMKEDSRYRGYARIENGLMGLPFQFYSFTLANINKTVAALAHGQVKNRAIGISTMMGLSYMSLSLKTPDFVWDEMSIQDKAARSFDMSGIMALYSDLFYTGMHTTLALGGPNITAGLLQPKFNQEKSYADAVIGLAGAGPSWAQEVAGGVYQFASGEYGEGGMRVARRLPFANLWFLKDDVNQITRAWAN
tara:strand:+ start:5654 stop:9058 length:3405 start_codon:yes stop_codon:yes gene_type:complete